MEVVSETDQIDVDAVIELRPDLVVATLDSDRVDVSQIERRTTAPVYLQPSRSIRDVQRAALELGFLVGEPVQARQLVASLRQAVAGVEQRLAAASPVSVFVDLGFLITVSDNSLLGDLVRVARGTNIAAAQADLGPFPVARLKAADPEVYLATSDSRVTLDLLRRDPDRRGLAAVLNRRVEIVPVELVTHPGPRIAEGLEAIALALHPDAFR
jgi:iron complex transport system substrate-binding protein